jgi:hypothetical protein
LIGISMTFSILLKLANHFSGYFRKLASATLATDVNIAN